MALSLSSSEIQNSSHGLGCAMWNKKKSFQLLNSYFWILPMNAWKKEDKYVLSDKLWNKLVDIYDTRLWIWISHLPVSRDVTPEEDLSTLKQRCPRCRLLYLGRRSRTLRASGPACPFNSKRALDRDVNCPISRAIFGPCSGWAACGCARTKHARVQDRQGKSRF